MEKLASLWEQNNSDNACQLEQQARAHDYIQGYIS